MLLAGWARNAAQSQSREARPFQFGAVGATEEISKRWERERAAGGGRARAAGGPSSVGGWVGPNAGTYMVQGRRQLHTTQRTHAASPAASLVLPLSIVVSFLLYSITINQNTTIKSCKINTCVNIHITN